MIGRWIAAIMLISGAAAAGAQVPPPPASLPSAHQIVGAWRQAIKTRTAEPPSILHLRYRATENGLDSRIEQWVTADGAGYRESTVRPQDHDEILLSGNLAQERDWNDFVRSLDGTDLERLRSSGFVAGVIGFGPPPALESAKVGATADASAWTLTYRPRGGTETIWYVDRRTSLPTKVEEGGGIAATFSDWTGTGPLRPGRIVLSQGGTPAASYLLEGIPDVSPRSARPFAPLRPGRSDVVMASDVVTLPFTMEANHIIVQARLNNAPPIGFILDTGDAYETINRSRLAAFNLTSYGSSQTEGGGNSVENNFVSGANFDFGPVQLRNQHATVLEMGGLEKVFGIPLGGILGFDFISRFVVEIDYRAHVLRLHRPDRWRYAGSGSIVPITFDQGIPFADVILSVPTKPNLAAHVVLDSGASDTMILSSAFVKANDLIRLAATDTRVRGMAGSEKEFFAQSNMRGRIDALRLGNIVVRSIPVSLSANTGGVYASSTLAGTIGEGIYGRFHVFFDYTGHRVIFEPTPASNEPFQPRPSFGLTILAGGTDLHVFTITAVAAGSRAEGAGFKKGDVVEEFDGRAASQFRLGELREWLSTEGRHKVRVRRAGEDILLDAAMTADPIARGAG